MDTQSKFSNLTHTLDGAVRASVTLGQLQTLWFNTGTLCNLTCSHCYIESSPENDRLAFLTAKEAAGYLKEIRQHAMGTRQIGFTGGEPFMNPDFLPMLEAVLIEGYRALVLTNAMRPMMKCESDLLTLARQFKDKLEIRVSLDHFHPERHQEERGPRSWTPAIAGLEWLAAHPFRLSVAGRMLWGESESTMRAGFAGLFHAHKINIDAQDPRRLVIFPEMDESADTPEITNACWSLLGKSPDELMCSNARMVVKRKGSASPSVIACTLLPYEEAFELGTTLSNSSKTVSLNHPHCSRFCVLGGGSCSVTDS